MQQIEAARREIIARAYAEKIGQGAPKPTAQEVNAYYEAHPALFSQRRIYNLQEVEHPGDARAGRDAQDRALGGEEPLPNSSPT